MPKDETQALSGVTIVVTRPEKQADGLCQLIEQQGGTAIRFPSLEIKAPDQPQKAVDLLTQLGRFNVAIFVSSNAVEWAAHHIGEKLPANLTLVAVGKSTGRALKQQWQHPVLSPETGSNSEAILALPEMQNITGQQILIIRGQGGRELLADELSQRGATVSYAEVYQRTRPAGGLTPLQQLKQVDLISATSNESLQNLYDMALEDGPATRDWLQDKALVVISPRAAELARTLGFKHEALVANEASDTGLLDAMTDWAKQHSHVTTTQ